MNTPASDENQPMRDALRRDAARLPKADFDPALHHAVMRRLHALDETPALRWGLTPALLAAAALLFLTTLAVLKPWQSPTGKRLVSDSTPASAPIPAPRTSLLAYQAAANDSDAALFAMLDRDASALLPTSPSIFRTPLP